MISSSDGNGHEFIGGTVNYAAKLHGLKLPETEIEVAGGPAIEVMVSCDGTDAILVVSLGPVDSEAEAILASNEAVTKVWRALLLGIGDLVQSASPPSRPEVHLRRAPRPGVVHVEGVGGISAADSVFITATPGAAAVAGVRRLAGASAWDPNSSAAFSLFESALREEAPLVQFLGLYQAMIAALALPPPKPGRIEPFQDDIDHALGILDPPILPLPAAGREPEETAFTRARNRVIHPMDRGITAEAAKEYALTQLVDLRRVVAALLARGLR